MEMDKCLSEQEHTSPNGDLTGLSKRFQKKLATVIAGPWQMATGEDRRWNVDENLTPPDFMTKLMQSYIGKLLHITLTDPKVAEAFFYVQHMIAPPTLFFRRDILWKVLTTRVDATLTAERSTKAPFATTLSTETGDD
jgi:hypothetical protein